MPRPHAAAILAFALAVLTLALTLPHCGAPPTSAAGPQTMDDVLAAAAALELHHAYPAAPDAVSVSVVLSTTPLDYRQAMSCRVGDPDHPCWVGRVLAVEGPKGLAGVNDAPPGMSAVWGRFWLFGDPDLIRQLLARGE
jgi:hypothetical protein